MSWESEMVDKLEQAKGKRGEASKIIKAYGKMTGYSKQQLYRKAKANGYDPKRRPRADRGECRLTEDQILWISGQLKTTARELKGVITPVEKAIQDAEYNGIIDKGCISVSRMAEILRERGLNKAALDAATPHTRMRSLHPNHVHLIDMSICIQFYLKGKLRMMREDLFYKNKFGNFAKIRKKLIRYLLVDHFSGVIFPRYFYTGGETQENLFSFLCEAWRADKHPKFPFRGVPFYMLLDAGAANTSHAVTTFLNNMDVKTPHSLPHNPRRQGGVEVAQNIVERWFESSLRIQPATDIPQLNQWALDWAAWFNATKKHSRHGMSRSVCWSRIRKEHLRELPADEILQELFAKPSESRGVRGDYTISYQGEAYDVRHIPEIMPGLSKVDVTLRPFTYPEIAVKFKDASYIVKPIGKTDGGFLETAAIIGEEFKAVPETITQQAVKKIETMAYGEDKPKKKADAQPFEGITVMGNKAEQVTVDMLPRKGILHAASTRAADVAEKRHSIMEALKRLRNLGIKIDSGINALIRETYPGGVPVAEMERLTDAARNGNLADALTAAPEIRLAGNQN